MSNRYTGFLLALLLIPASGMSQTDTALPSPLARALSHKALAKGKTAVAVMRASDGAVIAEVNANQLMNPASCVKIITTSAALTSLGPDYRFETIIAADGAPEDGVVSHLFIRGNGDPFLVNEEVWKIVRELKRRGIKKITGDIIIDDTFFSDDEYPGRQESRRAYSARTSAVAVNFNSIAIMVMPGPASGTPALVTVTPETSYITVSHHVTTGGKEKLHIDFTEGKTGEHVTVSGTIPLGAEEKTFYRNIYNPSAYAGAVFRTLFEENGISAAGKVRRGVMPSHAFPIFTHRSLPLSILVRNMNKFSSNFTAEQILKHLGAVKRSEPGTTLKGVSVVEDYLSSIGIPKESYRLENGSGFSTTTAFSARQFAQILVAASRDFSIRPDMMASFSIVGVDGTMKKHWYHPRELTGLIRAKTGTLNGVSTVAGYLASTENETLAFAIFSNGVNGATDSVRQAQMGILTSIAKGMAR